MVWLLEVLLNNIKEVSDNLVWGSGSINEEKILMRNTSVLEMLFIILLLVESNNFGYVNALKDISVFIWVMAVPLPLVSVLDWSHEGDKLSWDDPVEVSILNSLVVLVLLDIECPEVVPAKSYSVFESLEAVKEGAVVEALTLGGISVVLEHTVVWLELLVGLLSGHLEDDDHESSHEECSIDHPVAWSTRTAVVEYPVLRVVLVSEESCQLS
jgi:hypothetical protein